MTHAERGATLVEAVVAGSLLVTLATGTASLILVGHRLGVRTEQLMVATALATSRLQALRAVTWDYGLDGVPTEAAELDYAPSDALQRNTTGFWQVTDETGQPSEARASDAAFLIRWGIWPVLGSADARGLEVCVFPWPDDAGAPPIACVASVRTRQP